ncbi:MAG: Asp-tRNA(Asn)/Glu-tRNA(Gln) amidotransferase subunit GatC [Parcubacteria group bacterium]|nr:Asp-tRNA(Asn)/Glu-tRNA(Gln) amidotransferase subunit GatC [Parcubacteria group bacterium]
MPISIKDVERIAKLARLGLSEPEKKKYSKELSKILDYFEKLKEVNTGGIEPTAQVTGLTNTFRKDESPHEVDPEKIKKIIGQAPEREDNFLKTKPILEK